MKKLLFIAGVAAACSAFAADETVTGTTEVGMLTINSTATNCVVAVPYLELSTGGNICVSNIVKTANLTKGDSLYVYDGSGWTAWALKTSAGGAKYWDKVGIASIGANGMPVLGESEAASDAKIAPGGAIWLIRKDPAGSNPFYVYGGYQQALSTDVTKDVNNLVANPTEEELDITTGAADGDIVRRISSAGTTAKPYKKVTGGWEYTGTYVKEGKTRVGVLTNDTFTISAGQGVWYKPVANRTITWREAAN